MVAFFVFCFINLLLILFVYLPLYFFINEFNFFLNTFIYLLQFTYLQFNMFTIFLIIDLNKTFLSRLIVSIKYAFYNKFVCICNLRYTKHYKHYFNHIEYLNKLLKFYCLSFVAIILSNLKL